MGFLSEMKPQCSVAMTQTPSDPPPKASTTTGHRALLLLPWELSSASKPSLGDRHRCAAFGLLGPVVVVLIGFLFYYLITFTCLVLSPNLGSIITPCLTSDADVDKRIKSASAAFGALRERSGTSSSPTGASASRSRAGST